MRILCHICASFFFLSCTVPDLSDPEVFSEAKVRAVELQTISVIALLALMAAMSVTGLWTGDDILYEAPLTPLAPELAAPMGAWHQRLHVLVIPLVALHVLAILAHRLWLKEKLVTRMVTGGSPEHAVQPSAKRTQAGLALLALCVFGALSLSLLTPSY